MNIKSWISNTLRKVGFLEVADKLRFRFVRIKNKNRNKAFKRKNPLAIIPPDYFMYETYTLNYSDYYNDGKDTAKEIVQLFLTHNQIHDKVKILDWGCGPGRITQHLASLIPQSILYATDYNPDYISWCKDNIENVEFSINAQSPPLVYPNVFFDFVIGLSLFTHFSIRGHEDWFKEIYRITKNGGIVFITTQGRSYRRKLSEYEKEKFDNGELVVRSFLIEGNRLFSAFQPKNFIEKCIGNTFNILQYIPGSHDRNFEQDIWVLRKKS